jgi:hypothetical protein
MATGSTVSRDRGEKRSSHLTRSEVEALRNLFEDSRLAEDTNSPQSSKQSDADDLSSAYAKLGVSTRRWAFNSAVQLGIVTPWWANDDR